MKKYLVLFYGGASNEEKAEPIDPEKLKIFMDAWMKWAYGNKDSILDNGAPLSKTKSVNQSGVSDAENDMTAYAMVQAESQQEAAEMFKNHPHLTLFLGISYS